MLQQGATTTRRRSPLTLAQAATAAAGGRRPSYLDDSAGLQQPADLRSQLTGERALLWTWS